MAKANGKAKSDRALFLDRKLKRKRSYGEGISTVFPSDFSTPREALETLQKVSDEWLQVIAVTSDSATARSIIPTIVLTIEQLIDGVVEGIFTGTIPRIEDLCEWGEKELRDAGQNIVLESNGNDDEWTFGAARSLFRASEIARKSRETWEAEAREKSRATAEQGPTADA